MEHCITLFGHLSEATGHIWAVMVNLSSLTKITDHETFKMILQASAHAQPLVQLNILENVLNPVIDKPPWMAEETQKAKIQEKLLPDYKKCEVTKGTQKQLH